MLKSQSTPAYIAFRSRPPGSSGAAIVLIRSDGSGRRTLTPIEKQFAAFRWSPDGRTLLYLCNHPDGSRVKIVDVKTGILRELHLPTARVSLPDWLPGSDRLVFAGFQEALSESGDLYIYDIRTETVVETLLRSVFPGSYACSPTGKYIAFTRHIGKRFALYLIHLDGNDIKRITQSNAGFPLWSWDGKKIAFTVISSAPFHTMKIGIADIQGSIIGMLGQEGSQSVPFGWSPDSEWLLWCSDQTGNFQVYISKSDGSITLNLSNSESNDRYPTWSPDGTKIAFWSDRSDEGTIWIMDGDGSNKRLLTSAPGWKDGPPLWMPCSASVGMRMAGKDR
jgi:Tol biopolymer transport system component